LLLIEISESISVLFLAFTLIIALKHRDNNLKLITIYIVVTIIYSLTDVWACIFTPTNYKFLSVLYNSYDILEFTIINSFIFSRLRSTTLRIVSVLCFLFYFLMCYIDFSHFHFSNFTPIMAGIGYIFIAIPSLLLIFEVLKSDLKTDLRSNPDFLIGSGCLFYYSLCIPISFFLGNAFFANNILDIAPYLVCLTYFFYAFLIYTFIRAYLSPPAKYSLEMLFKTERFIVNSLN
jgi:hypothetical protein